MFELPVISILLIFAVFSVFLLWKKGLCRDFYSISLCAAITVLALVIRWAVLDYETLDYKNFLTHWVSFFKANGGFKALARPVGNYNIPYLYFLALL